MRASMPVLMYNAPMTQNNTTIERAEEFARQHCSEAAAELVEMKNTSVLRYGRVRELVAMLEDLVSDHQALLLAENLIINACLEAVAKRPNHESS